jgi:methylphosphotriester-DNA--protein-cysteine methyltransferase
MQPWGIDAENWARAAGNSIENLCVELQISRARLTMLTKEYCGLTSQELVDGFKIRRVKRALVARLRDAAQELWGLPGTWAAWKTDGYRVSGFGEMTRARRPRDSRRDAGGTNLKQSRYFRMRPEDYAAEERWAERARRIGELVAALRRNFDLEDWAARVGFASAARLKRACLNVLGRTLRAMERAMAEEVVRYYVCAEDKVLRQVACGDDDNPRVIRARWIYGKSEDAPKEPFLDEWSKAAELARDWLERMRGAFGCVT